MKCFLASFLSGLLLLVPGCSNNTETSTPDSSQEPSAEATELQNQMIEYLDDFKEAIGQPGDYVQIAVIDRHAKFPEMDEQPIEYSRVLVLHREVLDLDDYGFSLPGKEKSEAEEDYIPGFFGDLMFFLDEDANIILAEGRQPPGTSLVVEWCIPNSAGDQVSLHFGGNPCLTIDLRE